MAFKDKLKDIFKPNWEAEPKNTSGASAGNSPTVQPAAATSSSDWNFDSLFTKSDGTPSSGTASGFKSLDSIFQPKDQADVPEWKPEFDSQGFYKPTGKLSSRAYQRDIAAGNNYDAMGQRDKSFFSTYYQTLDNHTKLYTDLEDLTWGNTAENGKAFKSQYAEGLKSLRDELDTVGRQYGTNSDEYRALAQFKDDYFNLGRQISANYVDKDRRAMSQNLDDTIDTVLSGVVQAPDYQEKVEAGRKAIESNPTVYHRYKLGLEGASDKQRDLMYYIYANEGDKGAREFFDRVMGDTINYQKAAKDFTKDITTNDTKAARFWEANKANFAAAIDGQFGTGVRQLFTNTKADPDNRTIIKGYEISDSVDDFLRQQIALDEEELAIYGDDAFARLSSEVSADWVKEAAKDASDYQKGVLGYLYLAYKNPEASEALWEEIKGLDDEIWQMVNPGTVATAASSIEGGLYRDYLGLGSHKAPSWMGNPGEGEDKEDLAVAQAIWDFALTTRAQYPQMAGNILGALAGGPLVGQVLGSAIMSTSVYGNSYKESIEQGYSPKQAAAYGVSQAMSEFGTDMLLSGIAPYAGALTGNVGRTIVRRISNPFLQAVANLGIRSMGEGLQEYVQDIIDVPIRNIIFQENNKLNLADPGAVYSFFLGAMSAAAMSAPNIRSATNINKLHVQFGRALTKLDSTQKLVDTIINSKPAEGLTKEQRESYDKAVSIAKDLKAGRVNPNNRLVGEMFTNAGEGKIDLSWLENPTTVDYNKDALTVEDMAAGARARLAELHGNVDLAQDLARYATGEQVTAEFMQALQDDPIAAQVFSELTGELDMENDKNALTIAARSTTRNNTGNKDYDTLKAENTTQTVASPATTTLFKAGVEFEEAQQIGAVIEKVANGQTITEDEAELIPVGNSVMRQILSDTLGITIAEDATIGTVLQEMNNAAATMAETRSMQQEVANTAKQAAQARMPIPPNQRVDTTGTISVAGVEMNHDQYIENYMKEPGATREQAEAAWARDSQFSAALNGEEINNGRSPIPYNAGRRNQSLAAGEPVQEVGERGAQTGRPAVSGKSSRVGRGGESQNGTASANGYRPEQKITKFTSEQRALVQECRDAGFNSVTLVEGPLLSKNGQQLNAKVDSKGNLTIRWDNPTVDPHQVALHECVHLWLDALGKGRQMFVNQALLDIFGDDLDSLNRMYKAYKKVYENAYSNLSGQDFMDAIYEEILADMYAGMDNYGANAGAYQANAEMYLEQTNLRGKFFGEETDTVYGGDELFNLNDPFRYDADTSIPAEVRPLPGEPDAHPDLTMFSLTGMAEGGNFELRTNSAGQPYALVDKRTGEVVEHVTADMMVDTPLGNIVQMAMNNGNIDQKQARKQYQMLADAMNLIVDYKDAALVWELVGSQMFSAVKANSDKQYNKTIDFSTICKKTMAIVDAMSETMKKLGRGLTRREVEIVYEETGKKGLATPCPVCYVFSRWMGIGGLLDQMNRFQNTYANKSEEELVAFMKDIEDQARAYAAADPKGKYYDKNGNFLIGKVISDMKSKPNNRAASAMETLNQHQQAKATIAELERAKQGADPATVKRYNELIKKLRGYIKSEKGLADAEAKMQAAEAEVEPFEVYQWLAKTVMISDSSEVNEDGEAVGGWRKNPNFKPVPKDILFDLNKGGEFAHDYPLSWAFRTGKGCAAGKAIAPYSDARVGETIQGVALSDVKDIRIGDTNEFKNGDIKKQQQTLKSARKKQRRQNLIGGMRYQSTSDFRYEFGSDYLMTFLEMQAIGANVQLYTKVIEAVDFLASTGADCNLSVMPLGDGYVIDPKTGKKKLAFSNITGINAEAAIRKSKQYDNVQLILVGINDENIRLALEGTDVTFVIPFHGSGQSVHQVQTLMDLLGEQLDVTKAQDYTSVQTDRAIKNRETEHPELQAMWDLRMDIIKGTFLTQDQKDALKEWNEATTEEEKTALANRLSELGKMKAGLSAEQKARLNQNKHLAKLYDLFYVDTTDPAFYNNLANDQAEQIFPYEYWDKSLDYDHADENGRIFQEYCASIGVIPRFSGVNAKYEKTGFGDFTQDKGYWKLLIDRPMYKNVYDENGEWIGYGEYRAQQQINMTNIDIGDLAPQYGPFREGEISKQYDATHNVEDLATRDNIVSDSIKRIEALRGSEDVVERNALDRTRVKKDFRPKIMEAQSALREQSQTQDQDEDIPVISPETAERETEETDVLYSIREEDPPKKTKIGYKVFRVSKNAPGQLFPTKVDNPGGQGTPVGIWLNADTGEIARNKDGSIKTNKFGRISVKADGGTLAWRPGWHLGELPEANQMNQVDPRNPDSNMSNRASTGVMHDDYVFCECEFAADEDYQLEAFQMGFNDKGSYKHTQAGLPFIPKDGYYKYRTNPDPNTAPWFISGAIKITKILDDNMRREIIEKWNAEHPDQEPMRIAPRYNGKDIDLSEYGFTAGPVTPTEELDSIAPGVDYSEEIRNLPGYQPSRIDWDNPTFQDAFRINGIENRREELRQKYTANQERYSATDDRDTDERRPTDKKQSFSEGSAEQQMLDILKKANSLEDLQEYINKLIEKRNQSIERNNTTPPALPENTLFPVNSKQKEAGKNQLQKLINRWGALKKGEKAARDVNYPERTSETRFVPRTARTVAEAEGIPQHFADQIDQAVLSEALTYARITDKEALKKADADYKAAHGLKGALKEWNEERLNNRNPTKFDVAFGQRILTEAARNNDAATAMKMVADLATIETNAGQVGQAARMLKKMGPVGQLYYIQKAVDRIHKEHEGQIAKGKFQPIVINQQLAEAVLRADTIEEMDKRMEALIKDIADQMPVTLKDKWDAWRYFAMLGNPRTHIRNIAGNAIFAPIRFAKDLLASAGELFIDPEERTKNAAARLGSKKYADVREFAAEDFKNMQPYIVTGSKMNPLNEIMEAREVFKSPVLGKSLEKLRRWNDSLLNKEDIIFLQQAYINSFTQFVAARGLTAEELNGPKGGAVLNEARQYAALEAQKATYRDFSRLATALNSLRRNSGMGLLLDGLLPFTKTPINILRRGVEYSPVGLMKGVGDALFKVGKGDISAAQAIDEMAAGLTGTGVAILGYILASMGLARGSDDDDKKKQALEEAEGHQSYSLEIPGVGSYTIDWMAPVALPFFVGVEAHKQLVGDGEGSFWDFCNALTLLCEPMMSLSMLDGINSTLAAVKSDQNSPIWAVISNILASYVSQGAPTLGGQIARTIDPDRRSTYVDKNIEGPKLLQRTWQGIQGKIPGLASQKMAYVDVWGRKDTNSSALLRGFENFISPGYANRIVETPVDEELMRLYDSTGDNSVLPSTVAKYFQVEGETLNLNAKQYEQYKTVTGQTAFKLLSELMDDMAYGAMDDKEKAAAVKTALSIATALGKKAVAPTYKAENWVELANAQDNLETATIYHTLKGTNTGLSNYQLIEAMDWLTPEDRGKLVMEEHGNTGRNMTDYTKKKHKFVLTDEQIAREREIYNGLFWPAYNELIYSQKFMNADVAKRATMISDMQSKLGEQARRTLGDELRAAGYTSVLLDDSDVPDQLTSLYDLLNRG